MATGLTFSYHYSTNDQGMTRYAPSSGSAVGYIGSATVTWSGTTVTVAIPGGYRGSGSTTLKSGSNSIEVTLNLESITVKFEANGASGEVSSQSTSSGNYISMPSGDNLTYDGMSLLGWSTSSESTTAKYEAGKAYRLSYSTTLYAIWTPLLTLSYDSNGGDTTPDSETGSTSTTTSASYSTAVADTSTRAGYNLIGWGTSASDTSPTYQPGDSITITADTTLYALWTKTVTLTYDAQGGSPTPDSDTGSTSTTTATSYTTTVTTTTPARTGYTFLGWSDEAP